MGKTKHRIIVFLTGMVICLIVLEVALRTVGAIYADLSESDQGNAAVQEGTRTVLCIGDSVTFGIGAPRDLSYPAQLQQMLNASESAGKYTVINRGRPGQNSAQLLLRLEGYLNQFHPDIVTILIGAQNQANFFGYREYLETSQKQKRSLLLRVHDSLDRIRLYKFVRLLFRGEKKTVQPLVHNDSMQVHTSLDMEDSPGEHTRELVLYADARDGVDYTPECAAAMQYKLKGDYDKALESLLGVAETQAVESECYYLLGSLYKERKEYDRAIPWFKKGVEADPTQFLNYEGIGDSYRDRNQLEQAIVWFKKGFANARSETLHKLCYVGINVAFEDTGDMQGGIDFFSRESKRQSPGEEYLQTLAADYLFMFRKNSIDAEVYSWIETDIEQIIKLCLQYNARVILQNYPVEPLVNHIYRKVAGQHNIPFVDHEITFKKYVQDDVLSAEYFVPDGHPNARGYHLMAKNIWMVLHK